MESNACTGTVGQVETPISDQLAIRRSKLERLRQLGVNPYPYSFQRTHTTAAMREQFEGLAPGESRDTPLSLAGRLMSMRRQGSLSFADLRDQFGKIQLFIEAGSLNEQAELLDLLDLGDFIGVAGTPYRTKRGELSVRLNRLQILTKTLRPLPDKWHGLADPELVYRRRSEYFATEPEARAILTKRAQAISVLRRFLDREGFLEVETPILQPVYGGASAKPFETYVNALDQKHYLSISPELYLKRLVAGGFERVYTVCKNFRNEGIDRTHNPEFTMMECYAAYVDYGYMMDLTERLYRAVVEAITGSSRLQYGSEGSRLGRVTLDFSPPWKRVRFLDLVKEHVGIPVAELSEAELQRVLASGNLDPSFYETICPAERTNEWTWGDLVQGLFECFVESHLVQPTFVIDFPRESTPLCKLHRQDARLIERFEPYVYGMEIGNAYSELNDPLLQRVLFEDQAGKAERGDELAHRLDEEFLRAIEFGIPPTGGLGLGIDRMVMLMTGATSIRDVIGFPMMRTFE